MESGTGALKNGQAADGAADGNARSARNNGLDVASLVAVLDEAVRVRLAIYVHASPAVSGDGDVGGVNVRIFGDEVRSQNRSEAFGRVDGMLLGHDEDGVLHRVRGDNDAVVRLGVRGLDFTLQQHAHCHLRNSVNARGWVTVCLEYTDIVLAVACCRDGGHDDDGGYAMRLATENSSQGWFRKGINDATGKRKLRKVVRKNTKSNRVRLSRELYLSLMVEPPGHR